jgi:DNA-binding LacI/PurR family transcriptional regulator
MLNDKLVDGIIFLTSRLLKEHKAFFKKSSIPISLVNVSYNGKNLISIRIDHRKAAYDMTAYFLRKNYNRVGMIQASPEDHLTGKERFLGYRQALDRFGVCFNESLVKTGSLNAADGYRIGQEIVNEDLQLEALFVACDLMAFGAMKAFLDQGLKIPGDIEVAGFDDVPMSTYYHPALTTVRQPIIEMGSKAAGMLIKLIEGKTLDRWEVVLPHEIVLRESTAG